ncbi:MAG: hypothetical protein QOE54_3549 [Streptosporangiaceae bacterium]|jgi:hypothetical protein|nr:hypothetical protein [Streptosporangiaceae bacterium]MDX6431183.1 hypothetical protein [Streptosporangiaceae bacterium]
MSLTGPPRLLHPRHGIHEPTSGTPARAPGSVRRTSTIDMLRPDGLDGPLVLVGTGRDLRTGRSSARVQAEASCRAVVDFVQGRTLQELVTTPRRPALDRLLGQRVSSGFRGRLDEADPSLHTDHDLLYLLLDDLPVTTLVSGHAFMAGRVRSRAPQPATGRPAFTADLCAGFATGATIMTEVERSGSPPVVTGPAAPPLLDPDDALAWHPTDPLPPHGMRRTRRIDVRPGEPATVEAIFRDSYVLPDGLETVIHEYTLTAEIDGGTVSRCEAVPRALPWTECPAAAASAGRLAGVPLAGLRRHVRGTFTGISTCTHLNDMLRALEDVPALLDLAARH